MITITLSAVMWINRATNCVW